jgi:hypothetical protein
MGVVAAQALRPRFTRRDFMKSVKLVAFALGLPLTVLAADVAYSPPAGGMQITFNQGSRYSGMSLVNPAVVQGAVATVSGNVITVAGLEIDIGSKLNVGISYYVELVGGPSRTYEGERFDVDVAATQARGGNALVIIPGAANNTSASIPLGTDLSGYTMVVRPHVTLGQLFGTKENQKMEGSTVLSSADQVQVYNVHSQSFETYYFLRNQPGTFAQWVKVGGGSTSRDDLVIPPGTGFVVVRNNATPVTLTWSGHVRANHFAQPLTKGNNLIAQPFPVDASPASRHMTFAGGMAGSTVLASADKIQFPVDGVMKTYYLLRNASGTVEQWALVGGGSASRSQESLFSANGAVFLNKISADPDYIVPSPFSL